MARAKALGIFAALLALLTAFGVWWECTGYMHFIPDDPYFAQSDKDSPYLQKLPLEEVNFTRFGRRFDHVLYFGSTVRSRSAIRYYNAPCVLSGVAYTSDVGTLIGAEDFINGRGFATFPTYKKGWRYAIPLGGGDGSYYYVRLTDIMRELLMWRSGDDQNVVENYKYINLAIEGTETYNAVKYSLCALDRKLFKLKYYTSPDAADYIDKWIEYYEGE